MLLKAFWCFLLMFILMQTLNSTSLQGKVLESETWAAVEGALLSLQPVDQKTYSQKDGSFFFTGLESGDYDLYVRHPAYEEWQISLHIPYGNTLEIKLQRKIYEMPGKNISETRAEERKTPVAATNLSNKKLKQKSQGQDLPLILQEIPGLVSYSESGSSSGYSYMKVRGFDQKRIGVMVNGIPLNDPEDHRVYWVDMPDFTESIQDIQFQHGVGVSRYGIASFGGSLNIQTSNPQTRDENEIYYQYGSYNTRKYGLKFSSALKEKLKFNFRWSKIDSEGYRDNSASELNSFYTSLSHISANSYTLINIYNGHEVTHAAWDASWEDDLQQNHQHNPITYKNEIDDFEQPHFEIHNYLTLDESMQFKNSLFYIRGKGYYEQLKKEEDLWDFGLAAEPENQFADIIRQKWVEKNHYGWIASVTKQHNQGELSIGSYLSYFNSDHWGEVDGVFDNPDFNEMTTDVLFHRYLGEKKYLTAYINENWQPFRNLNILANIHYQYITYNFQQKEAGNFTPEYLNRYEVDYSFLNPQFGVNYNLNEFWNCYASFSRAHREPADNELYDIWQGPDDLGVTPLFEDSSPVFDEEGNLLYTEWSKPQVEAEYVNDLEFGAGFRTDFIDTRINLFYMDFKNEIVDYGGVDDEGYAIRGNADATIHKGVESICSLFLPHNIDLMFSYALSSNYFRDFTYDYYGQEIDLTGNQLAGFPQNVAFVRLSWQPGNYRMFIDARYNGKQYLDNTERDEHSVNDYNVWNFGLDYNIPDFKFLPELELQIRINNIFDLEYETAGYLDEADGDYDYEDNFFYPAAGRNITAGIRTSF